MNTTDLGRAAEAAVADHLKREHYQILVQNWRRRTCEIDLVAQKDKVVYFVEVKYRTKDTQGSGLYYITNRKLKQMEFAAKVWTAENNWEGDYRLMAAEVRSDTLEPVVENIIEL
jgi:putative endonuclease